MSSLCLACGLCCDGSLFGRVPLAEGDARKHLRVIPSGTSFEQPCSALREDRSCAVYTSRPAACRAFTCKLYEAAGDLEASIAIVKRTRALLEEAHATHRASGELTKLLDAHFARA